MRFITYIHIEKEAGFSDFLRLLFHFIRLQKLHCNNNSAIICVHTADTRSI